MPTPTAERLHLDPLPFRERVLANGLRAITLEDHRSPTVAINVGYRVGGKDDPPGRSGFAHLFEHLMFKGRERTGPETMDRLTEDVGGYNNAFTAEDITNYYEVVPSNHLETLLWAEADRLSALLVDETNFVTERDVVISEYDQRILAEPYGMLDESSIAKRIAASVQARRHRRSRKLKCCDARRRRAFHTTYYRPDNASLVVVGDFESDTIDKWIDEYFGSLARPQAEIPRVTTLEPPSGERRLAYQSTSAPLPALSMSWHIGRARDAGCRCST